MNPDRKVSEFGQRCREELLERVVPFWYEHGIDRQYGGFFSCLDRDGSLYDDRKYLWLQGRAVWMFARLYREVEARPEWLEAAARGLEFIRAHGRDDRGRLYFSLTRQGQPFFYQRKPYAAVFYLLALVEYHRATGDAGCLQEARQLFDRIVQWIGDPSLLDRPVLGGQAPASQLADVMVLAGMAAELMRVHPDEVYRQAMVDSIESARRHFDEQHRILMENAPLGPADARPDWPEARLFNPGHAIEVAWFMLHLLEHVEVDGARELALETLAGSLEFGWDAEYGGLFYFMDVEGKPALQLEASMKLWWPHTEALYALVLAYEQTGDSGWLEWLQRVECYCLEHFVDGEYGGWFGYCDRRGNLTHTCKGNHYKGFFHVPRALLFCAQRSGALPHG